MTPRKRKQIDPLGEAIEAVLSPGTFISYGAASSFVDNVRDVADDTVKIIKSEPERAALSRITGQVALRRHLQQKPPDRHHLVGAETHGDGFIGAPADDGPLRHFRLDHGSVWGADFALLDAGIGRPVADLVEPFGRNRRWEYRVEFAGLHPLIPAEPFILELNA